MASICFAHENVLGTAEPMTHHRRFKSEKRDKSLEEEMTFADTKDCYVSKMKCPGFLRFS